MAIIRQGIPKAASQEPARPWDEVDASLWSICFTNQARTVCFKCQDSGKLASQCPKKRQNSFGQWAIAILVNQESLPARELASSHSQTPTRTACTGTTTMQRATAEQEHASLPTLVAAVAGDTPPLLVS